MSRTLCNMYSTPFARLTPSCTPENAFSRYSFKDAYMCWNQVMWQDAADASLSFGFAAVPAGSALCAQCLEIVHSGEGGQFRDDDAGARLLGGKRLVVQAITVDPNLPDGQIDLMVPGGGTGEADNKCSLQWNTRARHIDLGLKTGGFLSRCLGCTPGEDCRPAPLPHNDVKQCVRSMCAAAFGSDTHYAPMLAACEWFVDFYEAADHPRMQFRQVECPREIWKRLETPG